MDEERAERIIAAAERMRLAEYVRYQNLLGGARAALDAKRSQYRNTVETILRTSFQTPEGEEESDAFLYDASNPQLVENLDRLIEREQAEAEALSKERAAAQKAVDEINTRKGAAEGNNQKLDELSDARRRDRGFARRRRAPGAAGADAAGGTGAAQDLPRTGKIPQRGGGR